MRRNSLRTEAVERPEILIDDDGFTSRDDGNQPFSVAWQTIIEIRAFKSDLFTVDEVVFVLTTDTGKRIALTEEQPEFTPFIAALESHFPSVSGWEAKVIQPPFARNETILYTNTAQ